MANTIDSLEIQITSNADKAARAMERLAKNCSGVSVALKQVNNSGLSQMSNSMYHLRNAMNAIRSVDTRTYSTLSNNLNKIAQSSSSLNQSALAMQRMNTQIAKMSGIGNNVANISQLASALSKLGYKSIQGAVANLPALTVGLRNLITTLNSSPQAIRNTTQLAYAIGSMANQLRRLPGTSSNANTSMKQVSNTVTSQTKTWGGLASAIGKFYATYFLVIRGVKSLWNSVKSSMDYLETLNYFNAAMEQVASRASDDWKQMGYDNATDYYNSFSERTREITSQLTGYNINNNGTLTQSSGVSLGLNPTETMQYQAQFSQMSSSMGVSSENALKLSEALTKIGADLASVKNMEFADVWNDLSSGLVGMSRTLDKYGVNIRNVNMQQKLAELGINANINSLGQADKALLRTIILLDSTQYAFGDLADTIQSPANQLRLFSMNIKMAGQLLGNLFMGVVSNALPILNGFAIALQRVLVYVGELLGVDMSDFASSSGANNSAISDILDDAENATEAVEELKAQIMGFDEINKLSDSSSSSSNSTSLTNAALQQAFDTQLSQYQKKWNDALKNMDSSANGIADRIEKALEPVKKIIGDFIIGDFFAVGQDTSKLIKDIENFIKKAIKGVDWKKVGTEVGKFLKGMDWEGIFLGLLDIINNAVIGLAKVWGASFETAPIETIIVSALVLMKFTGLGSGIKNAIAAELKSGINGAATATATETAAKSLGATIGSTIIAAIIAAIVGYDIGNAIYESITGKEADPISKLFDYSLDEIVNNLPSALDDSMDILQKFFLKVDAAWGKTAIGKFFGAGGTVYESESDSSETSFDTWLNDKTSNNALWLQSKVASKDKTKGDVISKFFDVVKNGYVDDTVGKDVLTNLEWAYNVDNGDVSGEGFMKYYNQILKYVEGSKVGGYLWNEKNAGKNNDMNNLGKGTGNAMVDNSIKISLGVDTTQAEKDIKSFKDTTDKTKSSVSVGAKSKDAKDTITSIKTLIKNTKEFLSIGAKTKDAKDTVDKFGKTVKNSKYYTTLEANKKNAENTLNAFDKKFGATDFFKYKASISLSPLDTVENKIDKFAKKIKSLKANIIFTTTVEDSAGNKIDLSNSAMANSLAIGSIRLATDSIPKKATGGIVEDGLFYANHNELIGGFVNGKTAVANNDQIIGGIAMGMSEATTETNALLRELIGAVKSGKDIVISGKSLLSAVQSESKKQEALTGRVAY